MKVTKRSGESSLPLCLVTLPFFGVPEIALPAEDAAVAQTIMSSGAILFRKLIHNEFQIYDTIQHSSHIHSSIQPIRQIVSCCQT